MTYRPPTGSLSTMIPATSQHQHSENQASSTGVLGHTFSHPFQVGYCPSRAQETWGQRKHILSAWWEESVVKSCFEAVSLGPFERREVLAGVSTGEPLCWVVHWGWQEVGNVAQVLMWLQLDLVWIHWACENWNCTLESWQRSSLSQCWWVRGLWASPRSSYKKKARNLHLFDHSTERALVWPCVRSLSFL